MTNSLKIYLIFLLIFCFTYGCNTKDKFKIKETICFKKLQYDDSKNKIVSYAENINNNKNLNLFYNTKEQKIVFRDILLDSVLLTVPMNVLDTLIDKTIHNTPFYPCYVLNPDSIYYVDGVSYKVYMLNSKGEITRKWIIEKQNPKGCIISPERGYNTVIINNNKIYISCYKEGFDYKNKATLKTVFDAPTYLIGDLNEDTIKLNKSCGNYPQFYQNEYYYEDPPYTCIDNKGRIIFSFRKDDNIYVYQKDSLIKVVEAKSKYTEKFEPFDINQLMDIAYVMRYYQTQPNYLSIYFDCYRNKYYRIYEHSIAEFDSNNKKTSIGDKEWSIIIMDENFNKIKEIKIDPKKYSEGIILITSKGVLLYKKRGKENKENCYSIIDI